LPSDTYIEVEHEVIGAVASESKKFLLFKSLIAVGFVLSIVLLFQSIWTYKYVAGELIMQEAERDTQRKINTLVGAVRTAQTQDMGIVGGILEEFLEDWNQQVAWVRILDGTGRVVAATGVASSRIEGMSFRTSSAWDIKSPPIPWPASAGSTSIILIQLKRSW